MTALFSEGDALKVTVCLCESLCFLSSLSFGGETGVSGSLSFGKASSS